MASFVRKLRKRFNDHPDEGTHNELNTGSFSEQFLTYDILRLIFRYLNYNDLCNAEKVCRSWSEAVSNEKKTRLSPVCMVQDYQENLIRSGKPQWDKENEIYARVSKLMIKPRLGLYFTGGKSLIHSCIAAYNYNITITTSGTIIESTEKERSRSNIVCAYLPYIPDVDIKTFLCGNVKKGKIEATAREYVSVLMNFLAPHLNPDKSDKSCCLLLFSTLNTRDLAESIMFTLQSRFDTPIPVWGGFVENITYHPFSNNKIPGCFAIAIAGSRIQSWTYTICDCDTEDKFKEKLKLFRTKVKLKKHSLGFMFACYQRGERLYNKSNVEATAFKSIFPNVQLVGCFGYGEFGTTTIDIDPSEISSSWYNELSTVLMILTYC